MDDFMSTNEAAQVLGMTPAGVSRLIRLNKLAGKRFGHYWMVERESVARYAEATKGKSPHDPTRGESRADKPVK